MTRARGIRAAAAALAVAGALAGCGGDDDETAKARDLTAVKCPLVQTGETKGGVARYEPAKDAFDTAQLVGDTLDDARAEAAEHGCEVIVSMKDGKGVPVPLDVDPKLIYVFTEDGVVTKIEGVGGGI